MQSHARSLLVLMACAALCSSISCESIQRCPVLECPSPCDCEGGYLLKVAWFGRLGNNLLQLAQSIRIAELTQNEVAISIDVSHQFLNRSVWDFRADTNGHQIVKTDEFFYSRVCPSILHKSVYSVAQKRQVLQTHVLPFFQIPIGHNRDSVVVHIRSGDVFSTSPPPTYTQPPFAFYKYVLGMPELARLKILLCIEDSVNPVVNLLKKEYGRRLHVIEDLDTAIGAVVGAKHLVLGQSSFSELLGMMAPALESVYIPFCMAREDIYVNHKLQGWGVQGYCFEYKNYIRLDEWANTAEQLLLMTSLSVDNVHSFALPL